MDHKISDSSPCNGMYTTNSTCMNNRVKNYEALNFVKQRNRKKTSTQKYEYRAEKTEDREIRS